MTEYWRNVSNALLPQNNSFLSYIQGWSWTEEQDLTGATMVTFFINPVLGSCHPASILCGQKGSLCLISSVTGAAINHQPKSSAKQNDIYFLDNLNIQNSGKKKNPYTNTECFRSGISASQRLEIQKQNYLKQNKHQQGPSCSHAQLFRYHCHAVRTQISSSIR